jgi:hypothetical protein
LKRRLAPIRSCTIGGWEIMKKRPSELKAIAFWEAFSPNLVLCFMHFNETVNLFLQRLFPYFITYMGVAMPSALE